MKLTTTPLLAIVTAAVVIGMITVSIQQVYAPRDCGSCVQFKKLTHELEKNVIETTIGDPGIIPGLLDQYNQDVRAIDLVPRMNQMNGSVLVIIAMNLIGMGLIA